MDFLTDFRNSENAKPVLDRIHQNVVAGQTYRLMEFCGGHTHTLFRFGIPDLLPSEVQMMHGPGCPVCVLPISCIDQAITLAKQANTILCSYGDMLRVPGSHQQSLLKARAEGANIKMLYSPAEALILAQDNPSQHIIFFAIGFETTTPPTALILQEAKRLALKNFSVFCNHVLTPPAIQGILEPAKQKKQVILEGLIGPGHVSLVTGEKPYHELASRYQLPIVISGFEPLDLLQSISMLIEQINHHTHKVENQYTRAVTFEGNLNAQNRIQDTMTLREEFEWRGLGFMPLSALKINDDYQDFDAEKKFAHLLKQTSSKSNKACICPQVLCGQQKPTECKLFDNPCTPQNPLGSCMVSSEGACAAYYRYQKR